MQKIKEELKERFFRYVAISSQSDAQNSKTPSSAGQLELAKLLSKELKSMGLEDIFIDEYSNLTALFKGAKKDAPKIGFVAHLDTVNIGLNAKIKPQVLNFVGEDLCLNKAENIWLKVDEHKEILPYKNNEIIFSDGTNVLGADDKAAITTVMTLLNNIKDKKDEYGEIYIAFVPDEEIGLRGSKRLDLSRFKVDFAYTLDCCEIGEIAYETFNAASVVIDIKGVVTHPMSAKNILVNPIIVMQDLLNCFDKQDTPEHTEGKEGYFYVTKIAANANSAKINISIRDFDKTSYEKRKNYIKEVVEKVQNVHKKAKISCEIEDVYANIKDSLGNNNLPVDIIFEAMSNAGVKPKVLSMRGGTDGSALSACGIPTPNFFTGAHNFHSIYEFLPMNSFYKSYEVASQIVKIVSKIKK
ncbi:MAG: peptidase T [Campylobacteraceae bacterium]